MIITVSRAWGPAYLCPQTDKQTRHQNDGSGGVKHPQCNRAIVVISFEKTNEGAPKNQTKQRDRALALAPDRAVQEAGDTKDAAVQRQQSVCG